MDGRSAEQCASVRSVSPTDAARGRRSPSRGGPISSRGGLSPSSTSRGGPVNSRGGPVLTLNHQADARPVPRPPEQCASVRSVSPTDASRDRRSPSRGGPVNSRGGPISSRGWSAIKLTPPRPLAQCASVRSVSPADASRGRPVHPRGGGGRSRSASPRGRRVGGEVEPSTLNPEP